MDDHALTSVAANLGATSVQVAIAWLLVRDGVIAIPKAGSVAHVRENRAAVDLMLPPEALARLDRAFPAPAGPVPLQML